MMRSSTTVAMVWVTISIFAPWAMAQNLPNGHPIEVNQNLSAQESSTRPTVANILPKAADNSNGELKILASSAQPLKEHRLNSSEDEKLQLFLSRKLYSSSQLEEYGGGIRCLDEFGQEKYDAKTLVRLNAMRWFDEKNPKAELFKSEESLKGRSQRDCDALRIKLLTVDCL